MPSSVSGSSLSMISSVVFKKMLSAEWAETAVSEPSEN